ncbi:site-specific integrase [Dactylosporangium vinaceum]|uniref:Tyrosine-type recombinase/integrase n=1 Tax=Dactylosporangium vinaceum TaxID=53362 RepID=A0ABV5MH31_9ACTN|nr:site-specific integrase [Dactylosporangium vinaceum]UAB94905.1 site-specific integrase [Dactylosporangium vinaceum]
MTTARRGPGEGSLYWDEQRQRYIAAVVIGYTPAGKRIMRRGSGKTKTEARAKLKDVLRDHEDGLAIAPANYTVADAVKDWLAYGLAGRSPKTVEKCTGLCNTHVIPALGARKLRALSATDVDKWLAEKAKTLSTATLGSLHNYLNRAVKRAMARDKVKRNVVALCGIPTGQPGRPSKSLTLAEATALLDKAQGAPLEAYIVVSLLTGARTEELRALTWEHVDLEGDPPAMQVWRSVRAGGDTKTKKSRRTLALPARCVAVLRAHRARGSGRGLVFATSSGGELDAANVRRAFRAVAKKAGLTDHNWTPRELRHSFVSLLSSGGMRIEEIADLMGHAGTRVTEAVYRHELRPVLLSGATAMDRIFRVTQEA